jgi:ketosteroid isomerase-like protein
MSSLLTIQQPITGKEQQPDLLDPMYALIQFYRALNAREIVLMERNWANADDAVMDNPLGGIKRGWDEIRAVYERLFRFEGTYWFEFYDYTLHRSSDLFYVVGRERGRISRGANDLNMKIRTTRVFRFDGQAWQQVHHHGSIDDPDLLAAYQASVR